jgi:hypothetical protein
MDKAKLKDKIDDAEVPFVALELEFDPSPLPPLAGLHE